jgi:hypothetical protein
MLIDAELLQKMADEVAKKIASGKKFEEAMPEVLADHRIYNLQERKFCYREVGRILGSRNKKKRK